MKKLILLITLVLLTITANAAGGSLVFLPQVYDSSVEPTPMPTETPMPSPTPENPPGLWTWVGHARNWGSQTNIYGEKPSGCYEVTATKSGKRITVLSHYIGDVKCQEKIAYWNEHGNIPGTIPFPLNECTGDDSIDAGLFPCFCPTYAKADTGFFCGEVWKYVFDANSQRVCSGDLPWNCVDSR